MKIKSKVGNDVYFEEWPTVVSKARYLWIISVLQTGNQVHFILQINKGKKFYVLTAPRGCPFRLIDETYAVKCVSKYIVPDPSKNIKPLSVNKWRKKTWKIWGTAFINEVDENHALSNYEKEHDKNIFQYLVKTEDEWIEFISGPPTWRTYQNITLEALIAKILKEDKKRYN